MAVASHTLSIASNSMWHYVCAYSVRLFVVRKEYSNRQKVAVLSTTCPLKGDRLVPNLQEVETIGLLTKTH